jgi:hypothetical protein
MNIVKLNSELYPDDLETLDNIAKQIRNRKDSNRRYLDAFQLKGRTLNLDRRDTHRDRRIGMVPDYCGFWRREIIDRRENLVERRE